jgi:hypothetical protein
VDAGYPIGVSLKCDSVKQQFKNSGPVKIVDLYNENEVGKLAHHALHSIKMQSQKLSARDAENDRVKFTYNSI